MEARQELQTGSRERVKSEAWQNRQSEGNKAASRLRTASPAIRGASGFPVGMLSQLLLKTGLLWKRQGRRMLREGEEFPHCGPAAL